MAKHVDDSRVVPLIVDPDLTPAMLDGPLGQLQGREGDKDNIRRLVKDISATAKLSLTTDRIDRCFDAHWERLKNKLDSLPAPEGKKPEINEKEMISQMYAMMRSGNRASHAPSNLEAAKGALRKAHDEARHRMRTHLERFRASDEVSTLVMGHLSSLQHGWDYSSSQEIDGKLFVIYEDGSLKVFDTNAIIQY